MGLAPCGRAEATATKRGGSEKSVVMSVIAGSVALRANSSVGQPTSKRPIAVAVIARPSPRKPSFQITMKAAAATSNPRSADCLDSDARSRERAHVVARRRSSM